MQTGVVRIVNQTRGTVLAEQAEVANTPFKRLKGLLGRQRLKQGEGLIIIPCSSIHTFFMRFSIDAVFLGKDGRVVALAESLPPTRLFGSLLKGKLVIELPCNTISQTKTSLNDCISMQESAKIN